MPDWSGAKLMPMTGRTTLPYLCGDWEGGVGRHGHNGMCIAALCIQACGCPAPPKQGASAK